MNKKFQVFISSTFADLIEERQNVIRSVLDLGHIPSGMEIFPAADVEQFEYIKKVVDECDYYVLIIGARYGSTDEAGVSFTEKEYDYAAEQGKTVLAFIHKDPSSIPVSKVDTEPALAAKLAAFREKISTGRLVQFWTSPEDLKSKVIIALSKAFGDTPGVGWVRGDAAASEDLLAQIVSLRNRLDKLTVENDELRRQILPNLEGLAGLESDFQVRFNHKYWNASRLQSGSFNITFTWAEIFAAVGPALMHPSPPTVVSATLVRYAKENKGHGRKESLTLFDTDEDTIKLQLIGLGLISSQTAEARGGGVTEFLSLTPLGLQKLLEIKTVRDLKQTGLQSASTEQNGSP